MNFGNKPRRGLGHYNLFIKLYFSIGSVFIFLFFIVYTNALLKGFRTERQVVPNLFARFFSYSDHEDWESKLSMYVFEEIVSKIDYPIILTDFEMTPIYWRNVGVDEKRSFSELPQDKRNMILKQLDNMERKKNVIPLYLNPEENTVLNYVFYMESRTMRHFRLIPYIEFGFVLIFILFGIYAIFFFRRNEKDVIWVGMAKEMAHQLGTPISSLLGWLNLIEMKISCTEDENKLSEIVSYMENDVEQLSKIANRFGKIGSNIELKQIVLHDLIQDSVDYFQKRLPHLSNKVDIVFISKIQNKTVNVEPDLIKWAVDNLIKNAIDAMNKKGGSIIVIAFQEKDKTYILVQDQGKGLPKSAFNKIFEPGVSSKQRGWGLGLSLSKRIIEEFHKGKIHVVHSIVDEGTTFEIILPEV
ncbi:MAG: HAMP domain-containing sensor histidine kinase [Candidatus Cloacimonas sp.]|nr:HAMP domain-containing histidine kinase [Candidatus Cloacimonadota bacterium]